MIRLDNNYYLESDANNWILRYEEKTQKTIKGELKEVTSKDEWFESRLEHALLRYMNESVKPSETSKELLAAVNKVEETIKNLKL